METKWEECEFCEGNEDSCQNSLKICFPNGTVQDAIPYGISLFLPLEARCSNCGVLPRGYHHPGCNAEICPRCEGLLTKCGCLNEKECDDSN